ncbi:MAG: cryptochrome/photolyase family protein, partial [Candidatus Nanohaloarchaea archaeon]|nr:cryptochrome/photolyase family protein [Candidatus Nanohaloarchaea archaeon]
MDERVVVFPHQLFADHPQLGEAEAVVLVEAPRFFTGFDYHAKKLVLHRASMQAYADRLAAAGHDVTYLAHDEDPVETVFREADRVRHVDTVDHALRARLDRLADRHGVERVVADTPMFMTDLDRFEAFFADRDYRMTPFYIEQRKQFDVLVDDGEPVGGQWSFDPENREKLPEDVDPPELPAVDRGGYVGDAQEYVRDEFPDSPGDPDGFIYPVTH